MGDRRIKMVKDTGYKAIVSDKIQQVRIALYNGDYGYAASILSNIKLTRKQFVLLCHECIEIRKTSALKILLEAYSIFWSQELFEDLAKFIVEMKSFEMISFLNNYIDRVNEYNRNINRWNEYVEEKNKNVNEKKSLFNKIIKKIFRK